MHQSINNEVTMTHIILFFFSSRRRNTRWTGDWSSDVCSSDLYWKEAGVEAKIELKLAPALETLDAHIEAGEARTYDLAFIDADKANYSGYYERILKLLRPGGLVLVDNVLWSGAVIDKQDQTEDTVAIRAFNEALRKDERVELSMLPIGDGLSLALKR